MSTGVMLTLYILYVIYRQGLYVNEYVFMFFICIMQALLEPVCNKTHHPSKLHHNETQGCSSCGLSKFEM